MTLRIHDLGLEALDCLPEVCRGCVFWESPTGRRGQRTDPAAKDAWWQATQLECGTPGKGLFDDGRLIAYAVLAPPAQVPRARVLGPAPSEDAVLLVTLWVAPQERGKGRARHLLPALLREAHARSARALECFGDRRATPDACVVPAAYLQAAGFALHRADPRFPLYRMDLRQTARWSEQVEHVLEGVLARLGSRERRPAPVPQSGCASR